MSTFSHIPRLLRPLDLCLTLLTYCLGLGVAHYLGSSLPPASVLSGACILLFLQSAASLLAEYFRPFNEPILPGETRAAREQVRTYLLVISAACLAAAAMLAFLLRAQGMLPGQPALILVTSLFLALLYALPPIRLLDRGFGEILVALQIAVLAPAAAFFLHAAQPHPFLTSLTFPLFLLALAWQLAGSFEHYTLFIKYQQRRLLTLLSWERAITVHQALILGAYLFLAALPFLGIPFHLVWPALTTLPVAAYQLIVLRNIAAGARPLWPALNAAAGVVFGLTVYLLTLTFWLN